MRKLSQGLALLVVFLFAHTAFAQRGGEYAQEAQPTDSPWQGYPGYFDSYMAAPGDVVFDLPTAVNLIPLPLSTIDYGVNERLTVGTNAGTTILPLLLGGFGLSAKLRTLIYGDSDIQSTITVYGGFMRFSSGGGSDDDDNSDEDSDDDADASSAFINVDYEHLSSNTSFYLSKEDIITGQVAFSRFGLQVNNRDDLDYVSLDMFVVFLGGQYQHFFSDRFGFEVAGMYPIYQRLALDSPGVAVALQADTINFKNALFTLLRSSAQYKYQNWIFNLGALYMPPFTEFGIWFGAGFKI